MSKNRIKELLSQLQDELRDAEMDDELQGRISDLNNDIHGAIENDGDVTVLIDRAKEMEAGFATRHPAAERFMQELIDALVRMGI